MNRRLTIFVLAGLALAGCDSNNSEDRLVGQLESDRIELTAEFAEPITERQVIEGQAVAAGQTVLVQDQSRANARIQEAEARLSQYRARLDELVRGPRQEQIEAAQATVDGAVKDVQFRKTELRRAESLLERELASAELRDRALAALDSAEASLEFSRARLEELLTGTTLEELEQARAQLKLTEAQLRQNHIDAARLTVTAPTDGVVDSLLFEPGERPQPGQPVAILLSGDQPYARVYVPVAQRVRVVPGTAAKVFVDGIDEPFDGRVRWVASEAAFTPYFALTEHDRGRLTFAAKVDIPTTDQRLPDGVPVEVEIVLQDGGE